MGRDRPAKVIPCPEAGCRGILVPKRGKYGPYLGCTARGCRASHSVKDDGVTPMGIPADRRTRRERIRTHRVFDKLWKGFEGPAMSRPEAYRWLQGKTGLSEAECHIGRFDVATCRRVRKWVRQLLKKFARERRRIEQRRNGK